MIKCQCLIAFDQTNECIFTVVKEKEVKQGAECSINDKQKSTFLIFNFLLFAVQRMHGCFAHK